MFLDLEGDAFVEQGGLEYLFGILSTHESGALEYQRRWTLNRMQEREAFEWLIDLISERLARFPDLHVYHYRAYEESAVK